MNELKMKYIKCPKCKGEYALYFHRNSMDRNGVCAHCYKEVAEKDEDTKYNKEVL